MSYGMTSENRIFLLHSSRTFKLECVRLPCNDGPYVWSRYCMSALRVFRENLIFSPLSAYSPTPKANKGFLGLPNTDYNLHAK